MVRVLPVPPIDWPQDTLTPPTGFGAMPAVSAYNASRVRREFAGYCAQISNLGPGESQLTFIQSTKDGDFWCSGINAIVVDLDINNYSRNNAVQVNIFDDTRGVSLFRPYIYANMLLADFSANATRANVQNFLQPYCFQRGTPIRISAAIPAKAAVRIGYTLHVVLVGWKEYENASR